jgi:low temperature requirement protein LtrA
MEFFGENFRKWWQIPRPIGDRPPHRTVTFLELFYDLVYVIVIAQVAHALASHVDRTGFLTYVFLFITVWWAWFNGMSYHDGHGNDDIRTRVFTFIQMILVAFMAVFAHDALGEAANGFAISYGLFLVTLAFLWWRSGYHDPDHRVLSRPYSTVYLVSTLLFLLSVFVPDTVRLSVWIASVILSLLLPVFMLLIGRNNPDAQAQLDLGLNVTPSYVERFGLFTIIVLGEVIVGVVNGLNESHHITATAILTAILGMLIGIGLWWVYFDSVSHRIPYRNQSAVGAWAYLHIPLTAGIAATGAALLNVVEHAGGPMEGNVRWLLLGSVATVALTTALLINVVDSGSDVYSHIHNSGLNALFVSSIGIVLLGFLQLNTIPILASIALLLLLPIYFALRVWLSRFDEVVAVQEHEH